MLAVQGPRAREIVQALADGAAARRFTRRGARSSAAAALVCGTGYTGEDGVELLLDPADAPALWDELCAAAPRPPDSPLATPCAWRSATTSTATT